jgi:hypothetical protein
LLIILFKIFIENWGGITFLSSVATGLIWTIYLLVILVLLSGIKIWLDSGKKKLLNFGRIIESLLIKIRGCLDGGGNTVCDKKIPTIQKRKPIYYQTVEKEQNAAPITKAKYIDVEKKLLKKSKNYRLISDKNLPYPILKRAVFIGSEE